MLNCTSASAYLSGKRAVEIPIASNCSAALLDVFAAGVEDVGSSDMFVNLKFAERVLCCVGQVSCESCLCFES